MTSGGKQPEPDWMIKARERIASKAKSTSRQQAQQSEWGNPKHASPAARRNGRGKMPLVVGAIILGIIVIVALAGGNDSRNATAPSSPAPTTAPPKPVDATDGVTTAQEQAYLNELDAAFVDGKPDRAIAWGQATCNDLKVRKDGAAVLDGVRKRFGYDTGDSAGTHKLVNAARRNLCPTAPQLGPVYLRMPSVSNMSLLDADERLGTANIDADNVEFRYSIDDNGPPINPTNWAVVKQSPQPGTRITEGRKVTLYVVRTDTGF